MLACITCEKVILLKTEDNSLRIEGYDNQIVNSFLLAVCISYEKDGRKKLADSKSDKEITMAMWTSLSISWDMVMVWLALFSDKGLSRRRSISAKVEGQPGATR